MKGEAIFFILCTLTWILAILSGILSHFTAIDDQKILNEAKDRELKVEN
jgi:hypothetical protein